MNLRLTCLALALLMSPGYALGQTVHCPVAPLCKDGNVFLYVVTECSTAPVGCTQTFCNKLMFYTSELPATQLSCQGNGGQVGDGKQQTVDGKGEKEKQKGCVCKCTSDSFGSGTESRPEVDFATATAIEPAGNLMTGCDSYFVTTELDGETKYFRCYKMIFKPSTGAQAVSKYFAFQSSNPPPADKFTVQNYDTVYSSSGSLSKVTVSEPQAGGQPITREFTMIYSGTLD